MTLLLKGGRIVDPAQNLDERADLLLEDGRIADIGTIPSKEGWEVVDVSRRIVTPGLIDMHVHLREPGQEDKETIATGSRSAVEGGFTSIACMPNTRPVNDSEAITSFILERSRQVGLCNIFPVGAITKGSRGRELAEIGEMARAGIVAISDDGNPVQNNQVMRRAMEYASIFDLPVLDHCEDLELAGRGSIHEGRMSTVLGLRGLSRTAEEMHVIRDIVLSRITKCRVHICHISTRESLQWVRMAKDQGLPVTCEVTPHHFILNDETLSDYDTNLKMKPPLRATKDVEAMLEGLEDGTIDCIATDHAPHTRLDKERPFEEAANGIVGLETSVSLAWQFLVNDRGLGMKRVVELLSLNPSRILKLDRGTLRREAVADVTVIDPERQITVDPSRFKSKGRNSPFGGWTLKGCPETCIVGGRIVRALDRDSKESLASVSDSGGAGH